MDELIISADSHVVEPGDLWRERLPAEYQARAPFRRVDNGIAEFMIEANGKFERVMASPADHALQDAGASENQPNPESGYNPAGRLEEIEKDGIWAEVLYPTTGLFGWSMTDPELSMACARVYNDWVAETFAQASNRFICGAMIPLDDLGEALTEVKRARDNGFRSLMLPMVPPAGKPFFHTDYDPIWETAQAAHMPVSFHVLTGTSVEEIQKSYNFTDVPPAVLAGGMITANFPAPELVIQTVMSGVLDRFPELHLVLVETQTAWLAWVVEELNKSASDNGVPYSLPKLPGEYIRNQVHATFMDDRVGINNIPFTGARSLMWGSDYPHGEGTWPNTRREIAKVFEGCDPQDRAAIIGGTAAEIFGIQPPA